MIKRITILGGSSVYIPEFFLSLISHNINVEEVVLIGRSERKLDLVSKFCQRLIDKSGFLTKVIGTTDLSEGVKDAQYIINHIRVGGMPARIQDEKLPIEHGIIGDETLGAGGIANALRTLPVVLEYGKIIEQHNTDAFFINFTNPTGICVEALSRYSNLKVIGVCDLPVLYVKKVAEILHANPLEIQVDYIGLNHMGWIQDVKKNGESYMATLLECLEQHRVDGFDYDLIELFRMVPTRTTSLYFHQDRILKKQKTTSRFRAEVLHEAEQQILKLYEDESLSEIPELARARNAVWYELVLVPLIKDLEYSEEHEHILCVPNNGAIADLPSYCSVEIPVSVSKKGLKPKKVGYCPSFLKGLFFNVKESDRLIIEAVMHQSYEYALKALTINPLVPSLDAAKSFLDALIKKEHLELH